MLQLCDQISGFSPDLLQQVHIFLVLRPPELDAAFRGGLTRAEQSREAQSTPSPYAALDAAENTFGFLGCRCTLPGHVELFRHKHPLILLSRETQSILHPASICACDCTDPGAGDNFTRFKQAPPSLVKVPLDDIPSLQCVNCTTHLVSKHSIVLSNQQKYY